MTMIRFHSPGMLARMMQEMPAHPSAPRAKHNCYSPSTNVIEKEDMYELELALPGMSKDDIKISIEKDILTIASEKENSVGQDITYTRREFAPGKFCRSFSLPESVDMENIRAAYQDGILRVELPKQEEAKLKLKRSIDIR